MQMIRSASWSRLAATRACAAVMALALLSGCGRDAAPPATEQTAARPGTTVGHLAPGTRVLLDAHNCYPYAGKFADRLERALATGLPLAIEQDLIWRVDASGHGESVVAHDVEDAGDAPGFEAHFFERLRPIMERALQEGRRDSWPLVVLNLDLKTNEAEHHAAILEILGRHEHWLTTAPRTATPDEPADLTPGPLLVLTGANADQQGHFHDDVPVGGTLRLFGATDVPTPAGETPEARARTAATMPADALIVRRAHNYRRWVNFPWLVVESGGQAHAGAWTPEDATRLKSLVDRAHAEGLWIRFYTLNGHAADDNQGWSATYNFGSLDAAAERWRASRAAGVDFVATDQYEAFARAR